MSADEFAIYFFLGVFIGTLITTMVTVISYYRDGGSCRGGEMPHRTGRIWDGLK